MSRVDLPDDVRRFMLTSVPSVPYIEALLLLRREPHTTWTAPLLARRIYVPTAMAAALLEALEASGVAVKPEGELSDKYRFAPADELRTMLDRVAEHYTANLVTVTELIHSTLNKRANQFADAFRWRKDK